MLQTIFIILLPWAPRSFTSIPKAIEVANLIPYFIAFGATKDYNFPNAIIAANFIYCLWRHEGSQLPQRS